MKVQLSPIIPGGSAQAEYEIDLLSEDRIRVDGEATFVVRPINAAALDPQQQPVEFRVSTADRDATFYAVRNGDELWVFAEGTVWIGEVADRASSGRASTGPQSPGSVASTGSKRSPSTSSRRGHGLGKTHHDSLVAPMPATVTKLLVEPGSKVREGDTVAILEAMKMELPLRATRDGTVTKVACREGELVQPGLPLLEIE